MRNIFFALLVSAQVFAGIVEFQGAPKISAVSGTSVKVFPETTVKTENGDVKLKLSGFGTRKKDVFGISVNVYVAASYLEDLSQVNVEKPLESIQTSKVRVLQLTLVRNVSGADLRASLEEALIVNGVDINSAAFQNFFNGFNFSLKTGESATLIMYAKEGNVEKVVVEVPGKQFSEEAKFLGLDLWKVWFGKIDKNDKGLKELQTKLLSNK